MNKINQNKITFRLVLLAISIIFSSLTVLCLPVLFNYNSKVEIIEKNFSKNFKIYLNSSAKISYKPFPKPHLLVEKATLNLNKYIENEDSPICFIIELFSNLLKLLSPSKRRKIAVPTTTNIFGSISLICESSK